MKKRFTPALSLLTLLVGCSNTMQRTQHKSQIQIDEGTVILTMGSADMNVKHKIEYRSIGDCQPVVEIKTSDKLSNAVHTTNCHGTGDHQGTIFEVVLSPHFSHDIYLNAGELQAPAPATVDVVKAMNSIVSVGGIRSNTGKSNIKRKMLLGAESHWQRDSGEITLDLKVKMGEIVHR
jgi:hypothetical protein